MKAEAIRYAPHSLVESYLQLGWQVAVPAFYCHHDCYSTPVIWICPCVPVEPKRGEG